MLFEMLKSGFCIFVLFMEFQEQSMIIHVNIYSMVVLYIRLGVKYFEKYVQIL